MALAVMARAPSEGSGKTRLLSALRIHDGAALRRAILLDTLDVAGQVRVAEPIVLFTPGTAEAEFENLTGGHWRLCAQRGEDLGERLEHAFADVFAESYAGALIIGSDLPTLPVGYLRRAASLLMSRDQCVVLGPARDGGYYLIGLREAHPELFRDIAWSTASVFAATVAAASRVGLPVSLVPEWYDIDSVDDLRLATAPQGPEAHRALRTEKVVARLDTLPLESGRAPDGLAGT